MKSCPQPRCSLALRTVESPAIHSVGSDFAPAGSGGSAVSSTTNPLFPRLRSGQRLFQRPSPQRQFPSYQPITKIFHKILDKPERLDTYNIK